MMGMREGMNRIEEETKVDEDGNNNWVLSVQNFD